MAANAALKSSDLNIGDTYSECLVEDLKRTQIVQYAGASGDYNPLHTDEILSLLGRSNEERQRLREKGVI